MRLHASFANRMECIQTCSELKVMFKCCWGSLTEKSLLCYSSQGSSHLLCFYSKNPQPAPEASTTPQVVSWKKKVNKDHWHNILHLSWLDRPAETSSKIHKKVLTGNTLTPLNLPVFSFPDLPRSTLTLKQLRQLIHSLLFSMQHINNNNNIIIVISGITQKYWQ